MSMIIYLLLMPVGLTLLSHLVPIVESEDGRKQRAIFYKSLENSKNFDC